MWRGSFDDALDVFGEAFRHLDRLIGFGHREAVVRVHLAFLGTKLKLLVTILYCTQWNINHISL